ncbi:4-alpha-glucanotransferase [bacterium]|nr:4-alpha-glucanotransferase [Spirochaetales bacterium]RQV93448.1 MAG: 4-alpha-glucanotransferase [bacterium]
MKRRASGVLLHISSLPSRYGIGDFGRPAYEFVDLLRKMKQSYWQILPLTPTERSCGSSPYYSTSAFAFNPMFIGLDFLLEKGLLQQADVDPAPEFQKNIIDFNAVASYKERCFHAAFCRFKEEKEDRDYARFCEANAGWLDTYALFRSLKSRFNNAGWMDWPAEFVTRDPDALARAEHDLAEPIELHRFLQFIAAGQWDALKTYANQNGVHIIGDIPLYVEYDSADVWANQGNYKLDERRRPLAVAGVPPDYFSKTGQVWGNPVYRWEVMKDNKFDWWVRRISHNLKLFDIVRIDHFRGLVAYWEVPAGAESAIKGEWVEAPAVDFLNALLKIDPFLPVIAEDLGLITPDVREIIRRYDLPGMKVLQFAFDSDTATNPYVPHNVNANSVMYTGTHDNNSVKGWFEHDAGAETKHRLREYLGREVTPDSLPWEMIRLAMMSTANTVIIPMQDLLCLGSEARMNTPSTTEGNWRWQLSGEQLNTLDVERVARMTEIYGRSQ